MTLTSRVFSLFSTSGTSEATSQNVGNGGNGSGIGSITPQVDNGNVHAARNGPEEAQVLPLEEEEAEGRPPYPYVCNFFSPPLQSPLVGAN